MALLRGVVKSAVLGTFLTETATQEQRRQGLDIADFLLETRLPSTPSAILTTTAPMVATTSAPITPTTTSPSEILTLNLPMSPPALTSTTPSSTSFPLVKINSPEDRLLEQFITDNPAIGFLVEKLQLKTINN